MIGFPGQKDVAAYTKRQILLTFPQPFSGLLQNKQHIGTHINMFRFQGRGVNWLQKAVYWLLRFRTVEHTLTKTEIKLTLKLDAQSCTSKISFSNEWLLVSKFGRCMDYNVLISVFWTSACVSENTDDSDGTPADTWWNLEPCRCLFSNNLRSWRFRSREATLKAVGWRPVRLWSNTNTKTVPWNRLIIRCT